MKNLIILPEVEQDIEQAYAWYERKKSGLGKEFLHCLDDSIQSIRPNPETYQIVHENYRRAVIRRFSHVLFYEYSETIITVYAVFFHDTLETLR
jgi:plasmid stabilization system protein ParE